MSKKMFSRERERGKLRFSALLILIGLLLFGCDPTMVTITYNANGGKGEMKPQAVESGVEVKLNANTFTKDGSDFTGWNEAADGSGKAYADGATVAPTGNLTLYAQWQVKSTPENPGTEDPGTEDPDPENPGTEDPEAPVVLEDHITNLALIHVVEEAYKLKNDNAEIGWTKTAEGYVDMTIAKNQELVAGVTSLGSDGDMSLDGIEYFTGLQVLILENNSVLTKLPDLTSLNSLRSLSVTSSSLTAVSDLPVSLETLNLNTNKLTTLNVSELTNLTHLDVSVNELTELDVDTNTKLTYLACFTNRMTALDITRVEAFSKTSSDPTPILACGLQEDAEGLLQALTLIGTQAQKDALASLIPDSGTAFEELPVLQKPNFGVVWDVPKAELGLTAGTAVFVAELGLKLPFTVGNTGALTQEELTELLTNATKTVTLFTADDETGTSVDTGDISQGVDTATPYILVKAAAFPQESTTYSQIKVVLEAEGYVTQTLIYDNVSVNPEQPGGGESNVDLQLTAGTAVFDKTVGLTLPFGEGQDLPENVNKDDVVVSLGGTQVNSDHVSFNTNRTAIIVALEALTNDTVGMTVTVTVSADGYNDAVLRYEGVNTVWIPDGVTATFDNTEKIGSESVSVTISDNTEKIGSESVSVTISPELSGVTIESGTYSVVGEGAAETLTIGADGRSFTAPILEEAVAKDIGTEVTVSLVLAKANAESVTVSSTLKVYPETHVRFNGEFYALAQGFNFTDASKLSDVKDGENPIDSVSNEGYVFAISPEGNDKKSLNFSLRDSEKIVLTMIEAKWDRNNCANIFVAGLNAGGAADYGWSPFKGNYSFMLGVAASGDNSGQRWNSKNDHVRLSVNPTENTFNKYFVFDNGVGNATLGFNDEVKLTTAAITSQGTIDRISSISSNGAWPLTFQHANGDDKTNPVTYTLRTVNFYKAISQQ